MEEFTTVGRDLRTMIQANRERIDTVMTGFSQFCPAFGSNRCRY